MDPAMPGPLDINQNIDAIILVAGGAMQALNAAEGAVKQTSVLAETAHEAESGLEITFLTKVRGMSANDIQEPSNFGALGAVRQEIFDEMVAQAELANAHSEPAPKKMSAARAC
jgi:hypothetical protein